MVLVSVCVVVATGVTRKTQGAGTGKTSSKCRVSFDEAVKRARDVYTVAKKDDPHAAKKEFKAAKKNARHELELCERKKNK